MTARGALCTNLYLFFVILSPLDFSWLQDILSPRRLSFLDDTVSLRSCVDCAAKTNRALSFLWCCERRKRVLFGFLLY